MITLYDIPAQVPGKSFSPNTFKARLAIAFKGLTFKTEYIEMPDIEARMKEIGAEPTTTKPDGSPKYTLPVIYDDATGKVVSDSLKIAEYLEVTYPDTPSLFPGGAHAPMHLFSDYFFPTVIKPAFFVFLSNIVFKFTPRGLENMRETREPIFKKTLEEVVPKGEAREAMLAATKAEFSKLAAMYAANGESKAYFLGDVPSYADLIVVSFLIWIRLGFGEEHSDWKMISEKWDGGRWGELLKVLEQFDVRT